MFPLGEMGSALLSKALRKRAGEEKEGPAMFLEPAFSRISPPFSYSASPQALLCLAAALRSRSLVRSSDSTPGSPGLCSPVLPFTASSRNVGPAAPAQRPGWLSPCAPSTARGSRASPTAHTRHSCGWPTLALTLCTPHLRDQLLLPLWLPFPGFPLPPKCRGHF